MKEIASTAIQDLVLSYLEKGIKNATSTADLMNIAGVSRRKICDAIEALRKKGYPIGSLRQKNGGYYIIDSVEEFDLTISVLKRQAFSEIETANSLEALKEKFIKEKVS